MALPERRKLDGNFFCENYPRPEKPTPRKNIVKSKIPDCLVPF